MKELFNLELEQQVIGSVIMSPNLAEAALALLKDDDFYFGEHQKIWTYLRKSYSINKGENELTIKDYVNSLQDNYFPILASKAIGVFIKESILEVKELSKKRIISNAAQKAVDDCLAGTLLVDEIKEALQIEVGKVEGLKEGRTEPVDQAMLRIALKSTASYDGTPINAVNTQFKELDKMTGGFRGGELIILAARPAMGKSALAVNIAVNAALKGISTLFFSFEMSNDQVSTRILSCQTSIPLNKIRNGFASRTERIELENKSQEFKKVPLVIQDTAGVDINSLKARIRKYSNNLGLVVVDYLQLIKGTRRNNRVEEVSEITRALKEMAIEFDIPIIALSQLSRSVESREDKRPLLSDLRESGSIEQDANIVIFLYRDSYYNSSARKDEAEIIIAKQRDGETGKFSLLFEPQFSRFINFF